MKSKNLDHSSAKLIEIGKNIRQARIEKDIKGETLGKKLGITKAAVSQMENGLVDYKISTLLETASFLNTTLTNLIEGDHSIDSLFAEYRFNAEKHIRIVNILVARIEYLNEQIGSLKLKTSN